MRIGLVGWNREGFLCFHPADPSVRQLVKKEDSQLRFHRFFFYSHTNKGIYRIFLLATVHKKASIGSRKIFPSYWYNVCQRYRYILIYRPWRRKAGYFVLTEVVILFRDNNPTTILTSESSMTRGPRKRTAVRRRGTRLATSRPLHLADATCFNLLNIF